MKNLWFKLGIAIIIFGIIMPLFSFAVPFLGLPDYINAVIIGFLIVGGPDLCLAIGAILAGKQAVNLIKKKIFRPAGKFRYNFGMAVFVVCFILNWVLAYLYVSGILPVEKHHHLCLFIMCAIDIGAFAGLLMMGPEFLQKAKDLFVWHGINSDSEPGESN
jgi:hypothetical protein